jgi:chloramphenicol 3-O-phosphotransferase
MPSVRRLHFIEGANTLRLIFLHGLPGVGKLTVARQLARVTGYKLFHNHLAVDLVESVFEFGNRPFVELREMIWLTIFSRAAEEHLAGLIFTFAYDRTVRSNFIEDARTAVEAAGGRISFVELRCSAEELERRIEQPSRREYGKLNSVARFRELKGAGVFVVPRIPAGGLVLETDGMSAAETAEEIFSRLGLGSARLDSDS